MDRVPLSCPPPTCHPLPATTMPFSNSHNMPFPNLGNYMANVLTPEL